MKLHEEQGGLAGPRVLREVQLNARLLLAAEGRVGHDHIEVVFLADLVERILQGVIAADIGRFDAM